MLQSNKVPPHEFHYNLLSEIDTWRETWFLQAWLRLQCPMETKQFTMGSHAKIEKTLACFSTRLESAFWDRSEWVSPSVIFCWHSFITIPGLLNYSLWQAQKGESNKNQNRSNSFHNSKMCKVTIKKKTKMKICTCIVFVLVLNTAR